MAGFGKKPTLMASAEFSRMFDQLSKQALIDTLWCCCQLGTDESQHQIAVQAARNACIALDNRGDRVPRDIRARAHAALDSD